MPPKTMRCCKLLRLYLEKLQTLIKGGTCARRKEGAHRKGIRRPSCAMSDAMVRSTRLRASSLKALPMSRKPELQQEVQDGSQGRPCAQHAKRSMSMCCRPRQAFLAWLSLWPHAAGAAEDSARSGKGCCGALQEPV